MSAYGSSSTLGVSVLSTGCAESGVVSMVEEEGVERACISWGEGRGNWRRLRLGCRVLARRVTSKVYYLIVMPPTPVRTPWFASSFHSSKNFKKLAHQPSKKWWWITTPTCTLAHMRSHHPNSRPHMWNITTHTFLPMRLNIFPRNNAGKWAQITRNLDNKHVGLLKLLVRKWVCEYFFKFDLWSWECADGIWSHSPRKTIATAQCLYHRFHLYFPRKDFNFTVQHPFTPSPNILKQFF